MWSIYVVFVIVSIMYFASIRPRKADTPQRTDFHYTAPAIYETTNTGTPISDEPPRQPPEMRTTMSVMDALNRLLKVDASSSAVPPEACNYAHPIEWTVLNVAPRTLLSGTPGATRRIINLMIGYLVGKGQLIQRCSHCGYAHVRRSAPSVISATTATV